MTSAEFLQQLAQHLQCLQDEERANAMAYYNEYFEEAGAENEAEAIERLGSPQSVAERIIREVGESRAAEPQHSAPQSGVKPAQYTVPPMQQDQNSASSSGGRVLFAVLVILLTSPFWIAIPIVWFTIVGLLAVLPLIFAFAGVVAPIQGIVGMVTGHFGSGLFDLGGGVLCIGLTLLTWKPCFWLAGKLIKLFGKLCVSIFSALSGKERRV